MRWSARYCLLAALVVVSHAAGEEASSVTPLARAHAHNDYRHERPLLDALDRGFCSVEADIFLVDGRLLVGHDRSELRQDRSLKKLYLEPLQQRVSQNGGRVFRDGPTVMLLIDIKSDGQRVYAVLRDLLASYKEILSSVENGQHHRRAVQVVISGDRPWEDIAADGTRYAGIDGRLSELESDLPAHLMPLLSIVRGITVVAELAKSYGGGGANPKALAASATAKSDTCFSNDAKRSLDLTFRLARRG